MAPILLHWAISTHPGSKDPITLPTSPPGCVRGERGCGERTSGEAGRRGLPGKPLAGAAGFELLGQLRPRWKLFSC